MWVLGLDGSATGDVTALVAVSMEDVPQIEVINYWQPTPGNPVPVLDVEERIREACKERQVVSIRCRPVPVDQKPPGAPRGGLPGARVPADAWAVSAGHELVLRSRGEQGPDPRREPRARAPWPTPSSRPTLEGSGSSRTSRSRRAGSTWRWRRSWRSTGRRRACWQNDQVLLMASGQPRAQHPTRTARRVRSSSQQRDVLFHLNVTAPPSTRGTP